MGERLTAEREAFVRACVSEINKPDFDAADHIIVELLAELDAVRAERDEARKAYAEREGDMHTRIRAGYDRTIADAWRAEVAKVTARAERAEAQAAEERERGHEALRKGLAAAQEKHDAMRAAEAQARRRIAERVDVEAELQARGARRGGGSSSTTTTRSPTSARQSPPGDR